MSAIQTSVSHAMSDMNFLYVSNVKKAVTNIFPALTLAVMALIYAKRLGFIGPTDVTASMKYSQCLSVL